MAAVAGKTDRATRLMKAMGSKSGQFDPEPPDQWLFKLRHGRGEDQALAWVKSKTIAIGHESAFAVDEHRKPLKLDAMAVELGWGEQTARNVLNTLRSQGRIRIDEHGRIWLCADVPSAHARVEHQEETKTGDSDDFDNFVQSYFSGYLADSIRGLSHEKRAPFVAKYKAFVAVKPDVLAEAMAAARAITDRYEHIILAEFGIEKRTIEKRRDPEPQFLRVELLPQANFVQSQVGEFVQTAKTTLYKPQNGSVQSRASLLSSDPDSDRGRARPEDVKKGSHSSSSEQAKPDATMTNTSLNGETAGRIAKLCGIEPDAATQLVRNCLQKDPDVTVERIWELWREKYDQVRMKKSNGEFHNFVGFMLTAVPKMIEQREVQYAHS